MHKYLFLLVLILGLVAPAILFGQQPLPVQPEPAREATPDFTFKPIKGKKVKLSSFQGKVIYIDVWASWCGPCFASFPSLSILKDKFEGQEVVFLTVSSDDKKKPWKSVSKRKNIPGTNLWAGKKKEILEHFQIKSIPRYILIDKNGRVYAADAPAPSSAANDIEALLAE